ncbi:hypothetical protein [Terriglobus roseus]|uniref:Uncharacterized protein n=1 Tax=Terriglobus roseus TaxID=392734 RepID=A0A1H4J4B3_9BACT|nr:hypothetical protein [Terriglobus roseus]SEB40806.1 hypothetical protein SAMN05443244_0333 [Terriglobus roseus]
MVNYYGVNFLPQFTQRIHSLIFKATSLSQSERFVGAPTELRAIHPDATGETVRDCFLRIVPTADGAEVLRPPLASSGPESITLFTIEQEDLLVLVGEWFGQVGNALRA